MASSSIQNTLEKIVSWVESLPEGTAWFTVDDNPSINLYNFDYIVDFEIKVYPLNRYSMPLTIQLSDNAIGFYLGDFKTAARLINSRVPLERSDFTCEGTEPITSIDDETILRICDAVSSAKFEIIGSKVFGSLRAVYTKIEIEESRSLTYVIGESLCFIKLLSFL